MTTTAGRDRRQASIRRLLESRALASRDSRKAGEDLLLTWAEIEARLTALIGTRGVEALFSRSLHLTGRAFKSLAGLEESAAGSVSIADVAARLAAVEPALAAEASLALLIAFTDLLSTLIGDSLTDRLLEPVWAPATTPSTERRGDEP